VTLDVLDVVQLGRKRILDVNNNNFPVGFAFVKECHDTKNFDLLNLSDKADLLADLANIERVVVTLGLSLRMLDRRVFPGLCRLI
jgi:hypothetical protein